MKKQFFEREMHRAQAMSKTTTDPLKHDYWMGYQRGLRRRYHGENFGTPDEHQLWLTATGDASRDQRAAGYHDGYYGPDAKPQTIRLWRDWSTEDLAERVGCSPRTVEGWEQGRGTPAY